MSLTTAVPPRRRNSAKRSASTFSNESRMSASPRPTSGENDLLGVPPHVRGHAAAPLGHAVHLRLLDVEPGGEPHLGEDVAGEQRPLATHPDEHEAVRFLAGHGLSSPRSPASSRWRAAASSASRSGRGFGIASCGQSCEQTSQPVHWSGSISASGLRDFSSSSSLLRIAGQPMRKQIPHPVHFSSTTWSGTHLRRASGSSAHSLRATSTAGSSVRHQVLVRLLEAVHIVGIDRGHVVDAQRAHQRLQFDDLARLLLQRRSRSGVGLMAGHRGRAVVEDDCQHVGLVVGDVGEGRRARRGRTSSRRSPPPSARRSRPWRRRGPRRSPAPMQPQMWIADSGGRQAERVAADVAGDGDLLLGEELEDAAVRAAGAEDRRAGR